MIYKEDAAYRAGKATSDAFGSVRHYSVVVTIAEVFFRTTMGVRYFTWRVCGGGLVLLIMLRFVYSYPYVKQTFPEYLALELYKFDAFVLIYLLLSSYHFYKQWRYESEGKDIHTYDIGNSRFFFIGKWLSSRRFATVTYRFIEPLILLLLVLIIARFSLLMAFFTLVGAFRLGVQNATILNRLKEEGRDIDDRKREASYIQQRMRKKPFHKQYSVNKQRTTPKPIQRKKSQEKLDNYSPPRAESSPSLEDILKRQNKKFHNKKPK